MTRKAYKGCVQCICRDCQMSRFVSRRAFDRVAIPRCPACGGALEIKHTGQKRMQEGYDAYLKQQERIDKKMGK